MNDTEKKRAARGTTPHASELPGTSSFLIALAFTDESWKADARCRGMGTDLFYADHGDVSQAGHPAKRICRECPVPVECADYGMRFGEGVGVWGGFTPRQMRARKRKAKAA